MNIYWLTTSILIKTSLFSILMLMCGYLVRRFSFKVNYTRKIVHFSMFFIPIGMSQITENEDDFTKILSSIITAAIIFFFLIEKIRNNSRLFCLMFESIDRPEDRPHTLFWLISQTLVGYAILVVMYITYNKFHINVEILYIVILSTTLGDGLAEPVGVAFGKHEYVVKGLMTSRLYKRTIEGSLCVFFLSSHKSYFFKSNFSFTELTIAYLLYPITMTVVEARSPHTWDTPGLFFFGSILLLLIKELV